MRNPTFICIECKSKNTLWKGDSVYCFNCDKEVRAKKDFRTSQEHRIKRILEFIKYPARYRNSFKYALYGERK